MQKDMSKTGLIAYVASKNVYPNDNPRDSKKKVREMIGYAQKIGDLSKGGNFDSLSFFRWAIKKWPELKAHLDPEFLDMITPAIVLKVDSLRHAVSIESALPLRVRNPVVIPKERKDLESLCTELNDRVCDLEYDKIVLQEKLVEKDTLVARLEENNKLLNEEVNKHRAEQKRRSDIGRENGRKRYT